MLAPGTLLSTGQDQGRYRVGAYLGGGGFGSAYRVADMTDGQPFVVKTLNLEAEIIATRPEAAEVFAREAAAARDIVHRNVVRTLGYVGAQDSGAGIPYLIMEYIAGGDLAGLIAAQNGSYFDQDTLVDWMGQLTAGLQAIHRDLLHRDLKPQNVLVDGATLKISDFGMSKYVEDATRTHTFKGGGTWTYMAPETWRGDSATHATDIYSLGIMFYELTTLRLPYVANDLHTLRQAHLYAAVPRPRPARADLDERLDAMIVRMLAKNPADRYASASEIARLIARISDPQGSPPLPEGANAVVRLARQKYNAVEAARAQETAANEEHDEHRLMVNSELRVFAVRLDHLVEAVNANLPERPIQVRADDDYLIDTLNARMYAYFDKTLGLGFFDLPKEDKAIGQARILAIGYITFSEHARGGGFMIMAGGATDGPHERGLHVVLVREPGQSYGSWKTCEIEENALYATQRRRQVQKKIVFRSLDQVLEAIELRNALHTHVTQIRDFTDDDFYTMLSELVA